MSKSTFVYVTYIRSTPDKVFKALTDAEITRQYWGHENISDWKPGSEWKHRDPKSGALRIIGEVVESKPPGRLVITWASPENPDKRSRVTFETETVADMVKLTVTHEDLEAGSEMDKGIRFGWPRVLSSLKSYLETGKPLDVWAMKKP
jgi:uncharacterized protein YndB with AHSA1/START domain